MATPPFRAERARLCDLLLDVGPEAPTLCEGWTTADLAAHLYVRERSPLAGLGILLPPLAGYTDGAMRRALSRNGFETLVARIRSGPPLGPMKLADATVSLVEYTVHHEDIRRGADGWAPRDAAEVADLEVALWANLRRGAGFMTRGLKDIGLVLAWPEHGEHVVREGEATATLTGRPIELVLLLNGRSAVEVEITGDQPAVDRLRNANLGI